MDGGTASVVFTQHQRPPAVRRAVVFVWLYSSRVSTVRWRARARGPSHKNQDGGSGVAQSAQRRVINTRRRTGLSALFHNTRPQKLYKARINYFIFLVQMIPKKNSKNRSNKTILYAISQTLSAFQVNNSCENSKSRSIYQ